MIESTPVHAFWVFLPLRGRSDRVDQTSRLEVGIFHAFLSESQGSILSRRFLFCCGLLPWVASFKGRRVGALLGLPTALPIPSICSLLEIR